MENGDIDLNPTDKAILRHLREGRCTPHYLAEETGYTRGNVTSRLRRLVEHGKVQKIHKGLYELAEEADAEAISYAKLETNGELRAIEHADHFGIPGGVVDVYMGINESGIAFWVVDGAGFINIYAIEEWPNVEELVQAHADTERELINRQNTDTSG